MKEERSQKKDQGAARKRSRDVVIGPRGLEKKSDRKGQGVQ
jgi:hypothetical protein